MDTEPRAIQEPAEHVCIPLPLNPAKDSAVPPPPRPPTSPHRPHVMEDFYPRPDSESEATCSDDSTQKNEDEDPLPALIPCTPLGDPPSPLPPPSSSSSSLPSPPPTLHREPSVSDDLLCIVCTSLLHDPMSLHCGHNFCQLCLAAMWKTSSEPSSAADLKCPVCRSLWRNFPAVNIQLRNIIERSYPQEVSERQQSLQAEDRELLEKFKKAKERESQWKDKVAPQLRRQEMKRLIIFFCCFFSCVLAILLVVFSLVFWTWAGAEGGYMRKPASQWTQRDVANWVGGLGSWATDDYSNLFLSEHITGPRLLKLDEAALTAIGIQDDLRRQSILQGIRELKEAEFNTPRNFHEFKAAHRRQTLMVALFFSLWPRLTLLHSFTFNYHDVFLPLLQSNRHREAGEGEGELTGPSYRELVVVLLETLFLPHLLVAQFAWGWAGLYPWLAYPVLIHCFRQLWVESRSILKRAWSGNWAGLERMNCSEVIVRVSRAALPLTLKHCAFFTVSFLVVWVLWHVTPHFLCDLIFQFVVWHSVFYLLLWLPLQRMRRICGVGQFRAQIRMNFNRPAVVANPG